MFGAGGVSVRVRPFVLSAAAGEGEWEVPEYGRVYARQVQGVQPRQHARRP